MQPSNPKKLENPSLLFNILSSNPESQAPAIPFPDIDKGDKAIQENSPIRKPLRACMVVYSFYESDSRVMMYANALRRRGDDVQVISLRQPGQEERGTVDDVSVHRIQPRFYDEKGKLSYLLPLVKFLGKSAIALNRLHREKPFDVIHVHSVPDFEVFAALFPKLSGAKIILDIHDIVPEFYAAKFNTGNDSMIFRFLALIEKISCRFSDHVIISNHIWKERLSRSVKNGNCTAIMNSPDPNLFYQRPRSRQDGKFIIIYPGSINWHQGLDIAIKAFALIRDKIPQAEFHIYGNGGVKGDLIKLIKENKLENQVFLKDWISSKEIVEKMANADLGVVPKRNDGFGGEAFSTKTLEFMSLGVPLLLSRTKIDQFYFNENIVKFFEPGNELDLSEKMLEMIQSKETGEQLAKSALDFVTDYKWERKKYIYLDLLDKLVNGI
jgi:glycosyltransferase involved in cell wall biosynthesis